MARREGASEASSREPVAEPSAASAVYTTHYRPWKKRFMGYPYRMLSIVRFEVFQAFRSKLMLVSTIIFLFVTILSAMGIGFMLSGTGPRLLFLLSPFSTGNIFIVIIAAFLGARAVCSDIESNSLVLYLARPLRRADYFLAKYAGPLLLLLLLTVLPITLVYLVLFNATTTDPVVFYARLAYIPPIFVFGLLMAVTYISVSFLFSTLTKKGNYAIMGTLVVLLLPFFLAQLLSMMTRNEYYLLFSLYTSFERVAYEMVGEPRFIFIQWYHALAILLLVNGVCLLIAYLRIRTMNAEVVR